MSRQSPLQGLFLIFIVALIVMSGTKVVADSNAAPFSVVIDTALDVMPGTTAPVRVLKNSIQNEAAKWQVVCRAVW